MSTLIIWRIPLRKAVTTIDRVTYAVKDGLEMCELRPFSA
jgi:hypothetical protein